MAVPVELVARGYCRGRTEADADVLAVDVEAMGEMAISSV